MRGRPGILSESCTLTSKIIRSAIMETPWRLSFQPNLDRLQRDLVPRSSIYQIVSVVKWSRTYLLTTKKSERAAALDRLERILHQCGPSERDWIVRRLAKAFGDTLPRSMKIDYHQRFPNAAQEYQIHSVEEMGSTD